METIIVLHATIVSYNHCLPTHSAATMASRGSAFPGHCSPDHPLCTYIQPNLNIPYWPLYIFAPRDLIGDVVIMVTDLHLWIYSHARRPGACVLKIETQIHPRQELLLHDVFPAVYLDLTVVHLGPYKRCRKESYHGSRDTLSRGSLRKGQHVAGTSHIGSRSL